MKDFLLKISLYTAIILLITNCATTKNSDTITNLKKTSFSENAAIYLAKNKSERNIFFKDSGVASLSYTGFDALPQIKQ